MRNFRPFAKKTGNLPFIVAIAINFTACGNQSNPAAEQAQASNTTQTGTTTGTKGTSSNAIGTTGTTSTSTTTSTPGTTGTTTTPLTLAQTWNAACASLTAAKLSMDLSQEIAVLCNGGTATDNMINYAQNAYAGTGTPAASKPIILNSTSIPNFTELLIGGAIKMPITMDQVHTRNKKTLTLTTSVDGVNISNVILSTTPAAGASNETCTNIQQTIKTTIAGFINLTDVQNQKECNRDLSTTTPLVGVSYRDLVPNDPVNIQNNNKISRTFNLSIQTDANTVYGFSVEHMTVSNSGMSSIAEQKIVEQPPALAVSYYNALTTP